jgi:hypothetical protein
LIALISAACIGMPAHATAAVYCWSVSHSSVDPFVNTGVPNGSLDTLFLWLAQSNEGMASAEIELQSAPGAILSFNVMNGFLNAGNTTHLLLAVGGCPSAPIVAGSILIFHAASLSVCLGGANVTVDCSINPQAWPNDWIGYADAGVPPCSSGRSYCGTDSIEDASWGRIKSTYR